MKYEVAIVYRGQCTFIVEADDPDAACAAARGRWEDGETADNLGADWEEVERIAADVMPVER